MQNPKKRLIELDALRGLAASMVVIFHYTFQFDKVFQSDLMKSIEFDVGKYGVQLFFIISGFVIFMTVEKVKNGGDFVFKRFIRLFPTFWLCLIISFIFSSSLNIEPFKRTFVEFLINFTMIPSLFHVRLVDGVYWSLFPELVFYCIIYFILVSNKIKNIKFLLFVWVILNFLIHFFFRFTFLNTILIVDYGYLFISGICFFKLWKRENAKSYFFVLFLCLLQCVIFKSESESFITVFYFFLFYLVIKRKMIFLSKWKIICFLGYISYPLYLLHQVIGLSIIFYLNKYFNINNVYILVIIPFVISIILAWIITKYFEGLFVSKLKNSLVGLSAFMARFNYLKKYE
ncbi:acyltransferase [Arachidicoccus ginsenosidivorans]